MPDISQQIQDDLQVSIDKKQPRRLRGGNTKSFLTREINAEDLSLAGHEGIINYEPTELVITARAGTLLSTVEATLASEGQMLAFEPPGYGNAATLGGTIACNLSGPARPFNGAARDFVLGCTILNGKAEKLSFGGEVMKNVAGYDVSRLMTGAMGTLGVLLDVSLKVLPVPDVTITLTQEVGLRRALDKCHIWSQYDLPVSATAYDGDTLFVRLSGSEKAIEATRATIGGDEYPGAKSFWQKLKQHQLNYFDSSKPLWRCSLASDAEASNIEGKWFIEWNGACRWYTGNASEEQIRNYCSQNGGHATLYRGSSTHLHHPLGSSIHKLHTSLKNAFDPHRLLNPGIMYSDI